MEVILKKTKITQAILKQAITSTLIDLNKGEILGWCLYKDYRYLVCYRSDINTLTKYLMIDEVTSTPKFYDGKDTGKHTIKVNFFHKSFIPKEYISDNETARDEAISILKTAKQVAQTRGQFFI